MREPSVSVCIPTRDRAGLVGEAIASALAQDGVDAEVLVCDDASAVPAGAFDGVRVLRNDAPIGVAATRSRLLGEARGRYVAWLDDDDVLLPGALARQVAVLDAHPSVSMVHGGFVAVGPHGEEQPGWAAPFTEDVIEPGDFAFRQLLASNEVITSTVVARRDALLGEDSRGRGGAPAEVFTRRPLASSSDWAMWLALARRGDVAFTAAPAALYRQHPATISHATSPAGERLRCDAAVVRWALRGASADARAVAFAGLAAKALMLAGDRFTRGDVDGVARAVAFGVRMQPRLLTAMATVLAHDLVIDDGPAVRDGIAAMLGRLADRLEGTRFGARVRALTARDPVWDDALARAAAVVRRVVPAGAHVGAVAKWDPALLDRCGRAGRNFPDRRTLPDGYPSDSAGAVAHLEDQRADGVTHLVLPAPSRWWLDHYDGFAAHLSSRYHRVFEDGETVIFDLRETA